MTPVIPHLAHECLKNLNANSKMEWPKIDQHYLKKENNEIVIQVNGKKETLF